MSVQLFRQGSGVLKDEIPLQSQLQCPVPNAMQVYQALFALATRDFPRAAALFLDSIATFTTCDAVLSTCCQPHLRLGSWDVHCLLHVHTTASYARSHLPEFYCRS